ncbi:methionyl-tRNA formyltransferase domain protein [Mycobacterium xenopi 3993]|nr:methionyl-tRNA formyltransferase domain protein [Mycobacterium xenopi 3993]
MPVRLVFAGTPETALPALRRLIDSPGTTWSPCSPARMRRPAAAAGRSRRRWRGGSRPWHPAAAAAATELR